MAKGRKRGGNPQRKRRRRTGGAGSSSGAGSNHPRRSASTPRVSGAPRPADDGSSKGRKPAGKARPTTGGHSGHSSRSKTTLRSAGGHPVRARKGGKGRKPAGKARSTSSSRTNRTQRRTDPTRPAADSPPSTAGSPPAAADGPRSASGPRQAARGTARRARTVTTQDGHPSRSGARRRSATARRRGKTTRSASGSGTWGPGRPSGSRLRQAATSIPRRPRYWLRWLLVIGIVLAIIGAISYAMIASATWVRATIRSQDDAEAASSVHTVYPNPVACDAAQLNVAVDAPKETTVGAGMSIEATLTNEGGDACLLDIGGASLGAVINSGDQTVWTSTTCPAEPTERPLLVDVGESAHASLTWSGMSTAAGCSPSEPAPDPTPSPETTAAQDPSASPGASASPSPSPVNPNVAAAGTYRLHLQFDGTDITGEQVFLIQ